MPQRITKKYRRVDSTSVQGEGSFVEFAAPTFNDIVEFSSLIFENELEEVHDAEAIKLVMPMLERFVTHWNWVDDDGNPLPQPTEDSSVIQQLTLEEQIFLVENLTRAFNLSEQTAKN